MTESPPKTPRARYAQEGQEGQVQHINDDSLDDTALHENTISTVLRKVTGGMVRVERRRRQGNTCRFILNTESLQYEQKIREAVNMELRFPYSIERSDKEGQKENPLAISKNDWTGGAKTLVVIRTSLYKPKTSSCKMTSYISLTTLCFLLSVSVLYWALNIVRVYFQFN